MEKMKQQREQDLELQRVEHEAAIVKERETVSENIEKSKEVELARWKQWLDDARKELNTYFMENKVLKQEKDSLDIENKRLIEVSDEQKEIEARLKQNVQSLKDNLRQEADTQAELRRKLDYMNAEKIGLQGELEVLENHRAKLSRKVSDLENDNEETRAVMRRRLSTAQEQRNSKEHTVQQMKEKINLLERDLETKSSKNMIMQTKLENLRVRFEKQEEAFMISNKIYSCLRMEGVTENSSP